MRRTDLNHCCFFFLRNRYGPLFNEEEGYAASDAATDDFYGM